MRKLNYWGLGIIVSLVLGGFLWFFFTGMIVLANPQAVPQGWTPVYETQFDTLSADWTITDTTGGLYQWGITPYTRTVGTLFLADSGLWVAGGSSVGQAQSWPTGTYTHSMTTWAVVGPFTPTEGVLSVRASLEWLGELAAGDGMWVGFSGDAQHFQRSYISVGAMQWSEFITVTTLYTYGAPIWVGLGFDSDATDVTTGPLVDNFSVEFHYCTTVYLPLILRPLPPIVAGSEVYEDDFSDPSSGWYVGPAMRYNDWCRWGTDCHTGWEEVTSLNYVNGHYKFFVPLTWHGGGGDVDTWFVWPAEFAPLPEAYYPLPDNFCVEARAVFVGWQDDYQPWWAHWGVVFGANAQRTELFSLQVNANHDMAVLNNHNYTYPGNRQPLGGEEINVEIPLIDWSYGDMYDWIPSHDYNTLRVEIQGRHARFLVNGRLMNTKRLPADMPRDRVGLIAGSWEVTPVDLRVDYFRYEPNCVIQ